MTITPIVIGNWKMNGLLASTGELAAVASDLASNPASCEVMICPPATLVAGFAAQIDGTVVAIGAQDCHWEPSGAFTGDISAGMIADAGGRAVIVGHSERRAGHGETDTMVNAKAVAAHREQIGAIICIGETEEQRDGGRTLQVLSEQLAGSVPDCATAANSVIAYEPVWAIGTGRTPTSEQIAEAHAHIRQTLSARFGADGDAMRLLYGGSVKPGNAAEIFAIDHVNGGLIGGASLKASDFLAIIRAV